MPQQEIMSSATPSDTDTLPSHPGRPPTNGMVSEAMLLDALPATPRPDDHQEYNGELRDGKRKRSSSQVLRPSEQSGPDHVQTDQTGPSLVSEIMVQEIAPLSQSDDFTSHKRMKPSASRERHSTPTEDQYSLPRDKSRMPKEIWAYVFTYLPPTTLAHCLRVNRKFHHILSPLADVLDYSTGSRSGRLQLLSPGSIWASARKLFHPQLPKPISGRSELEMWRLIRGTRCQFCGKQDHAEIRTSREAPWEPEIGAVGSRIIWPFAIRTCEDCLLERSEPERNLLLSSLIPMTLLAALPFVFLSPTYHVLTPTGLQVAFPPATMTLAKYFLKEHIFEIRQRFQDVQALGTAAAEEWCKGLDGQGKERVNESGRWERWEYNGGTLSLKSASTSASASSAKPDQLGNNLLRPAIPQPFTNDNRNGTGQASRSKQSQDQTQNSTTPDAIRTTSAQNGLLGPPNGHNSLRPNRSAGEINEMKAARQQEIERRCLEIDPPLYPNVLNHMESFQEAKQISEPLTDGAWEALKPLLIAQRGMAEQKQAEILAQAYILQAKHDERRQQDAQVRESKESLDREWDIVQAPIRERLGAYADEIIRGNWAEGRAVTKEKSPKFAADVLIYVRQRFYAAIAQEDAEDRAAGRPAKVDTPAPGHAPRRKLMLENMKWVFDMRIKPITEQFRKELFYCHGCDNPTRYYGFEGVVQHYAAKHTNELSLGNVVVHWKAEWPETPPFQPNPGASKGPAFGVSNAVPAVVQAPTVNATFPSQPHRPPSRIMSRGPHAFPQPGNAPFGPPQYPERFQGFQNGPFPPPLAYPGTSQAFPPPPNQFPLNAVSGFQGAQNGYPGSAGTPDVYHGPFQPPAVSSYGPATAPQAYAPTMPGPPMVGAQGYPLPGNTYGQPVGPPGPFQTPYNPASQMQPVQHPNQRAPTMYQIQSEEMASIAGDLWSQTTGIKDFPSSLRVHVIIYHMVLRFKMKFPNEPSFTMFGEGLREHPKMKHLARVNGLSCKTCLLYPDGAGLASGPRNGPIEKKPLPLPSLVIHFNTIHQGRPKPTDSNNTNPGPFPQRFDWRTDMIALPEQAVISRMLHAPGMDDYKLKLVADVFPDAFPKPLPVIHLARSTGGRPEVRDAKEIDLPHQAVRKNGGTPRNDSRNQASKDKAKDKARGSVDNKASSRLRNNGSILEVEDDTEDRSHVETRGRRYERYSPQYETDSDPTRARIDVHGRPITEPARQINRMNEEVPHSKTSRQYETRYDTVKPAGNNLAIHKHDKEPDTIRAVSDVQDSRTGQKHSKPSSDSQHLSPRKENTKSEPDEDEGSEDGEVGGGSSRAYVRRSPTPPRQEEISAAERFLNDFMPGVDSDSYEKNGMDQGRHSDANRRGRYDVSQTTGVQRVPIDKASPAQMSRKAVSQATGPEDIGQRYSAASLEQIKARKGVQAGPLGPENDRYAYSRPRPGSPQPTLRVLGPNDVSLEADARYRRGGAYPEDRIAAEDTRHPRPRFERYENYREERYAEHSRSPPGAVMPPGSDIHYHDPGVPFQSSRHPPVYRAHSPSRMVPVPIADDHYQYHPGQAQERYFTYAADPRSHGPVYDGGPGYPPHRTLSARSPPTGEAYYVGPDGHPIMTRYGRYEDELREQPTYDDGGALYRLDRQGYYAEEPHRVPQPQPGHYRPTAAPPPNGRAVVHRSLTP